jgi:hypothetical protein
MVRIDLLLAMEAAKGMQYRPACQELISCGHKADVLNQGGYTDMSSIFADQ